MLVPVRTIDGEEIIRWDEDGSPTVIKDARTNKGRAHRYDSVHRLLVTYDGIDPATLNMRLPRIGNGMSWTTYDSRGNALEHRAGEVVRVDPAGIRVVTSRFADRTFNSVGQLGQSIERVDPQSGTIFHPLANAIWSLSSGRRPP